ncbi:hypothetical protein Agabi119p4_680 [Agaricus bisporus var. burnettii]|uniref:Uncharacterized protein n=1 Tax=Agaricus bisporus var. burnettii TaxID=192524 RepID=A0A8H7FAZ0_AGABI|nr:hypothetical protein Agabi119p4_680 [Agaricus bisporus var. burnettii]
MANTRHTRSLPTPPAPLPAYEPPAPSPSSPKPPVDSTTTVAFAPPKSSPPYAENPPVRLSAAQQLYASSFANRGPPVPTIPPPSFDIPRRHGPEQPSFYKNQVSSYIPHSTVGARSPEYTASSTSSRHSFSDGSQRIAPITQDSRLRHNSATYARPPAELNRHNLMPIVTETSSWAPAYIVPQETRSLFPLTYVDNDKSREVRTVITTVKPPPSFEAPHPNIPGGSSSHASASFVPPLSPQDSEQSHSWPIILPPSPPPSNALHQSQQQPFAGSFDQQSYMQPSIPPLSPQHTSSTSGSSNPGGTNKNRTSRFMSGIKTSLVTSLGQLAVKGSVQSLVSGSSIEEEKEGTTEEGGSSSSEIGLLEFLKLDVNGSASASHGSIGSGGGSSEAKSTAKVPVPRSGPRYIQNPSASHSVAPPLSSRASGGSQYTTHDVNNTMNRDNSRTRGYSYTRQTHLPAGLQPPSQAMVYKPPLPGGNPY